MFFNIAKTQYLNGRSTREFLCPLVFHLPSLKETLFDKQVDIFACCLPRESRIRADGLGKKPDRLICKVAFNLTERKVHIPQKRKRLFVFPILVSKIPHHRFIKPPKWFFPEYSHLIFHRYTS